MDKANTDEKERTKLTPVVSGTIVKKQSEMSKVARAFIAEEATNIGSYILVDVLIPTIKDAILDALTMIFHGGHGKSRGSGAQRASKISYQPYYDYQKPQTQRSDSRQRDQRTGFEFDDLIFPTRGDAEMVLDTMNEAIMTYGVVSILDLHDFAGVSLQNYAGGQKYGWTDISGCRAISVRGGYILKLPRAVPI